jgi:hypothetical protein
MLICEDKPVAVVVAECEESLKINGYLVVDRHAAVKPGFHGKYMVYDTNDNTDKGEGYCVVGDNRNSLILDAFIHLEETFGKLKACSIDDDDIISNDFGITSVAIGAICLESGSDQYFLLTRKDGDVLTPAFAERWMLPRVYREGTTVGGSFCHTVNAIQKPFSETECICVVEHRLDN